MNTGFIKADIFFMVTTIAVVVVTIGLAIAFVYIVRILRDVKTLSTKARDEGEKIIEDVRSLREGAENKGKGMLTILSSLFGFVKNKSKSSKKKDNTV